MSRKKLHAISLRITFLFEEFSHTLFKYNIFSHTKYWKHWGCFYSLCIQWTGNTQSLNPLIPKILGKFG